MAPRTAPSPEETRPGGALDYRPSFPRGRRSGIGIVGCGHIVATAHLPAYARHGLDVVGAYDVSLDAARNVAARFGIARIFESFDALLADPAVEVVDIATPPDERPALIRRALAAGKHVLAQKPLARDVTAAAAVVDEAERRGLRLAVNQNARWAPAWRLVTLLVEHGSVGDVIAVTHLLDKDFGFTVGSWADEIEHFLIYDYCVHWLDISRCWLSEKQPTAVRAREYRAPNQPRESKAEWGAWIDVSYADGSSAVVRSVGASPTSTPSCLFWVHGSEGTIRGSILGGDFVELEREGSFVRYPLEGEWYVDGFAGAMGELMSAIAERREPYNSGRHNLLSLELTLAACASAEQDGAPVRLERGSQ